VPKIENKTQRKLKAVGAYVFAGGFTLGLKQAGFDVTHHLEDGLFGTETAMANFNELSVITDYEKWLNKDFDIVDLVFCNPPCSPWSTAGIVKGQTTMEQTDWRSHPSARCVNRSFSLLAALEPIIWCFESVRQVYSKAGDMLDNMAQSAIELGYKIYDVFVEAKNHGVPQHRKRYFMICSKVDIEWQMPIVDSWPTVYDALNRAGNDDDSCGKTPSSVEAIIKLIGQGENARMVWDREIKNGRLLQSSRPAFIYDRMAGDRPSYTLLGSCNKIHPDEDRMLSVNETKVLCGFPIDFKLVGNSADRYAQLGKGVCPPVARWLGRQLSSAIKKNKKVTILNRTRIDVQPILTGEAKCQKSVKK